MTRTVLVATLLSALAGCASTELQPPPDHLIVKVDSSGVAKVDGMVATAKDWPDLVKQRQITSAEIWGSGSKLEYVRRVQDELRAAGVSDVTITRPGHAAWHDRQQSPTATTGPASGG